SLVGRQQGNLQFDGGGCKLQDILFNHRYSCRVLRMKSTAKTVGDRVKERRAALGLSQPQLAKRVGGITYQAIQQLEQGGGTKHLVSIARALGVTAEWLQDGHGPAPARPASARSAPPERLKVLGMAQCGPDGWSLW